MTSRIAISLLLLSSSLVSAAEPQWIWSIKDAATKAEPGSAYFRKAFDLEEPESGTAEVAADSAFELFLNGRAIGTGDDATKRYKFNLTPRLLAGRNVLAIAASNGGPNSAGVAAKFTLKAKGKDTVTIVTDNTWKFNLRPQGTWTRIESDDSTWPAAFALGEYGKTAPWGKAGELVEGNTGIKILNKPRSREKGLFDFRDGDRVVFLGAGFMERMHNFNSLETRLTAAFPTKDITFRNLGWSGDTVWGDARAVFGSRADGFERLLSDVSLCNPTVLIVCYGENEAYAGEAGLEEFRRGLNTLLDSLEATGARIVFLGPARHESLERPKIDQSAYNVALRRYNDISADVCRQREHLFIDLYDFIPDYKQDGVNPFTEDGVHFNSYGYSNIANKILVRLGARFESYGTCAIDIDVQNGDFSASDTRVEELAVSAGKVGFATVDRTIFRGIDVYNLDMRPRWTLRVRNLPNGTYELRIDGEHIAARKRIELPNRGVSVLPATLFSRGELAKGIALPNPALGNRGQELVDAIAQKNELFFHRYRPQNETYLFLFRKHEQGNNAAEIPQFDPLIAELEQKIAELKKPVKQKYELIKVK
ncbi:MAG: GDSL-type esterase/lipase family protein [Pirellulaceae bacterium]